jgi:hypothetical protein
MPALNFQKQFAPLVKSGKKNQTIRALRKDGKLFKEGDVLYLFTGMRTSNCKRLKTVVCKEVFSIRITRTGSMYFKPGISEGDYDTMATSDGFKDNQEMIEWFKNTHGLPFKGQLIKW